MCGINLHIDKTGTSDESIIVQMNAATRHRGPDAKGWFYFRMEKEIAYLGNNRLSILDPRDNANQPFSSADGRYVLVYNGEIYNYIELRGQLSSKYSFRTNSDTEVLLYWLIEHGKKGLPQLNGMFAFVLADTQEKKIFCARDAHGIKPFYYCNTEKHLLISSELQGIFASGVIRKEFNEQQLPQYLRYRHVSKPQTFFKNVFELEEGQALEYQNGKVSISSWVIDHTHAAFAENPGNEKKILDTTKLLLIQSIEKHLRSDVPAGLFLSGGIDSTLLLACIRELGIEHFPTYCIAHYNHDKSFGTDDVHFAAKAADLYKADHYTITADVKMLDDFSSHVASMSQPVGDGAALLTWHLSRYVKGKNKVILSGAGADELFAGYNRHIAYQRYLQYLKNNPPLIKTLRSFGGVLPSGFDHPLRKKFQLLNKFLSKITDQPIETYHNFCSTDNAFQALYSYPEEAPHETTPHSDNYLLHEGLQYDLHQYLISDVLTITDQMSMAHSTEIRVPYLDRDLSRFAQHLAPSVLLSKGRKWILRELLTQMGGAEIAKRNKEGFGMPFGSWLRLHGSHPAITKLNNPELMLFKYLRYEKVQEIHTLHLRSKKDFSVELLALLVLAEWMEQNFNSHS